MNKGFTLIEMSIVMAIVALLAGGIIFGKAILRASEIRNMLGEYDSYLKALQEFQDKYHALPGDMAGTAGYTPQDMWGTDPNGCPSATNAVPKVKTCNGDGNGHIGDSTTAAVLSNQQEWFRAWQHLADANLVSGMFSGVKGPGGASEAVIGMNVPASNLEGTGWTLNYYLYPNNGTNSNAGSALWTDDYGHLLNLGRYVAGTYTIGAVLTPAEAIDIDNKIDDALPGTGKVRAWRPSVLANCTDESGGHNTQATAVYKISNSGNACSLVFLLGM